MKTTGGDVRVHMLCGRMVSVDGVSLRYLPPAMDIDVVEWLAVWLCERRLARPVQHLNTSIVRDIYD